MLVRNVSGEPVAANAAFRQLLGYDEADLPSLATRPLTHPDQLAESVQDLQELIAGEREHVHQVKRYRRKDGHYIWVRSAVSALRDATGAVQHLVFFIDDVSDQKQAEEALRESEERFRQIADNIQDAFWMTTADFRVLLYASPAVERLWGADAARTIARDPMRCLDAIHPDDRARVAALLPPNPMNAPIEIQFRVPTADGAVRWFRVRGIPIRDADGTLTRIAGITEDVTERARAAEVLAEARKHAARLVRAVREPLDVLFRALSSSPDEDASETLAAFDESFQLRAAKLTAREREVMDLLVAGESTKAIAAALAVSPRTVEVHRSHVMRKLRVRSVAALVRLALLGSPRAIP